MEHSKTHSRVRTRWIGVAMSLAIFAPTLTAQDSPLRATLSGVEFREGTPPLIVPVGILPLISVKVENPSKRDVLPAGPIDGGADWAFGVPGRVVIRHASGKEFVFRPDLLDCSTEPVRSMRPGERREGHLFLASLFSLSTAGKFELTAILSDGEGRRIPCEPIEFELQRGKKGVIAAPLTVSLTMKKSTDAANYAANHAVVKFKNVGRDPLTIVRPLDGSLYGWLEPHYWFEVTDHRGRPVSPLSRCGNFGGSYNDKTLVVMRPGLSESIETYLPMNLTPGRYEMRFHYMMRKRPTGPTVTDGLSGEPKSGRLPKEADTLFLGHVRSKRITVDIPGERRPDWLAMPRTEAATRLHEILTQPIPSDSQKAAVALGVRQQDALEVLRRMIALHAFSKKTSTRLSHTFRETLELPRFRGKRSRFYRVLMPIVDVSYLPLLWTGIREEGATADAHETAKALKKLVGDTAVPRLIKYLRKRQDDFMPLCTALATITDLHHGLLNFEDLGNGSYRGRAPRNESEHDIVRDQWLTWWRKSGEAWLHRK